jgi:hypothetical protein
VSNAIAYANPILAKFFHKPSPFPQKKSDYDVKESVGHNVIEQFIPAKDCATHGELAAIRA